MLATTSGYTDGTLSNPTYLDVCSGQTGHAEAVQVLYDPARVSYDTLLDAFWHAIDPTQVDGQFVDHGQQCVRRCALLEGAIHTGVTRYIVRQVPHGYLHALAGAAGGGGAAQQA